MPVSAEERLRSAWRHNTMRLELLSPPSSRIVDDDGWEDDEGEPTKERRMPNLFAYSGDGILAMTEWDFDDGSTFVRCFNLFTRCEIGCIVLPDNFGCIESMSFVNSSTILLFGCITHFDYFSQAKTRRVTALVATSDDGFGSVETIRSINLLKMGLKTGLEPEEDDPDMLHLMPDPFKESLEHCVRVGDGFVLLTGSVVTASAQILLYKVYYIAHSELCDGVDVDINDEEEEEDEEPRQVRPAEVGSFKLLRDSRPAFIPYESRSFAILQGESGRNRIEIYDLQSKSFRRSIPVDWPLSTTFPPPIVRPLGNSALLQSATGEKILLDLKSGQAKMLSPLIDPSLSSVACKLDIAEWLGIVFLSRSETIDAGFPDYGTANEFTNYYADDIDILTPIRDLMYLSIGSITVDGTMIGCYADTVNGESNNDEGLVRTLTRIPIQRVHSLADLSLDAIVGRLSRLDRMLLSCKFNPRTAVDFIKAILSRE